jgi:hypothetical protein
MVGRYIFAEADMHIMFGHAYSREVEAHIFTRMHFPFTKFQTESTFSSIDQHLSKKGKFAFLAAE